MEEKGSLIDLIIHDLTGPLTIVSTSIDNILKKEDRYGAVSDKQRKALERALRNSKRAQLLLQEMIEVYRSEEGLFRKEAFSVQEVLKEALLDAMEIIEPDRADILACASCTEEFFNTLKEFGITIDIQGKHRAEPFSHDPKKVGQIIRNLISNALKYRASTIVITVHGDPDLIVTVENDGAGIPVEKQSYIFKRFFQVKDNPEKDIQKGLGFGLSCVKSLVETMRGEISLTSEEGRGTCFTVRIPPLASNN